MMVRPLLRKEQFQTGFTADVEFDVADACGRSEERVVQMIQLLINQRQMKVDAVTGSKVTAAWSDFSWFHSRC